MEKILIVEDELIVARDLRKTLERNGYKVAGVATSVDAALLLIAASKPWLVLVDIFLKGNLTGIDLAKQLNLQNIPFIYVSANSNQPVLQAAKTTNPYGFIVKPFREKDLLVTLDIARYRYEHNLMMQTAANTTQPQNPLNNNLPTTIAQNKPAVFGGIIGTSSPMLQVFKLVNQVAPFDTSVLLLGESGTGKEGIARCIFEQSKRNHKPFIKINCSAIPAALMEAEFFGYEKGAFTGAVERKAGKFEIAAGGTMLLDEIGEMPIAMQVKLLRVLQEKEIQRIGSSINIKTDVRIIAATSRDLETEVAAGRFRLDLYYRLHVFPITLPPLRNRKEDIPLLAAHFINLFALKTGKNVSNIAPKVLQQMVNYNWPGNVRELEHIIERSVLVASTNTIQTINLQADIAKPIATQAGQLPIQSLEQNEREHILAALKTANGRVRGDGGAADLLKIPPTTLHSKMKKLGITKAHL
jgi:DNA-binding NtrC family response regulator